MDRCEYCGLTICDAHAHYKYMCEECGRLYIQYMTMKHRFKSNGSRLAPPALVKLEQHYILYASMGYKVPKEFRKEIR